MILLKKAPRAMLWIVMLLLTLALAILSKPSASETPTAEMKQGHSVPNPLQTDLPQVNLSTYR